VTREGRHGVLLLSEGDTVYSAIWQREVMHESRHLESSTNKSRVQKETPRPISPAGGTTAHSVLTSHDAPQQVTLELQRDAAGKIKKISKNRNTRKITQKVSQELATPPDGGRYATPSEGHPIGWYLKQVCVS
jgi:hypothetical protein